MTDQYTYKRAILLTIMSLGLFYMPEISPNQFWYSSFLALGIPVGIVLLVIVLIYWAVKKNILFLVPLVLLIINWKFIERTISFSGTQNQQAELSVLSYNIRLFNVYPQYADKNFSSSRKIIDFLKKSEADVLCLQEFYNDPKDTLFNTIHRIRKKYKYYYFSETYKNRAGASFGMIIFSKYPIKNRGKVVFHERSNNQTIYADVLLPHKTVRIYNMHLQSMSINDKEIAESNFDTKSKTNVLNAFTKFKKGTINRSIQVDTLVGHIKASPYNVIVCGDLNDPPYSYTYETLSDQLNNSFEEKGNGLGITFNGRLPFLRIDQQFCDQDIEVVSFETQHNITYTDHFPIKAGYLFK